MSSQQDQPNQALQRTPRRAFGLFDNNLARATARECGVAKLGSLGHCTHMPFPTDPAAVVQRQLDAFNARDIDALLATYAEAAELFEHPAKLLASGAAALRERFGARFQEANLRAVLLSRIVMGQMVVDSEEVYRTFPEGTGRIRLLMIYEVQDGRITKAWSIAGEKILDGQ
jgi:hypothetical protein